jgi:DNA-binding NtrC family response regulator
MEGPVSTLPSILFVDDDVDVQRAAAMLLPRRGFHIRSARNAAETWSALAAATPDVILLDLNFSPGATSGEEGLALLRALVAHDPQAVVVVVTGHSGIAIAVAAMRSGAADFVMKPWNNDRLIHTLTQAVSLRRQRCTAQVVAPPDDAAPIIGQSAVMLRLVELLHRVAPTPASVLLAGERGAGKTLLAHTIHRLSPRAASPLVTIDPAAAWESGEAALEQAFAAVPDSGTVLLDEAGGLPHSLQIRLQRMLEARPGLRVLTATRQAGPGYAILPDLLCRLNTVELQVPRLADRPGDAALLAAHFVRVFAGLYRKPGLALSPEAAESIAAWPWPGHVRELRQAIERAVVFCDGEVLGPQDIPLAVPGGEPPGMPGGELNLARSEKAVVEAALRRHSFNVSHAARELGLTRAALYRRMARHGL